MRDIEDVVFQILSDDEPPALLAVPPAEVQAPPLAERVVHEPHVLAHVLARKRQNAPGLRGEILLQELAEVALADEADARRILLLRRRKAVLFGEPPHLRLLIGCEREEDVLELLLRELIEKISLILILIGGLQEAVDLPLVRDAAVMARRDIVRAQLLCILLEGAELYFAVAQHVGVGRPARAVLRKEIGKDALHVLARKVDGIVGDIEKAADAADVLEVLLGGTGAVFVRFLPVAHEEPDDVIALLFEEQRGNGAVHAPAHAHYDGLFRHIPAASRKFF